jgi:hypothetical protein
MSASEFEMKKKKSARERIGKSGGELKLSAKNDEDARKYLADVDTTYPERFRYREAQKDDEGNDKENMKMVKSTFSSAKDEFVKVGEFQFNTGWMEIGYDKTTKGIITAFKGSYRRGIDTQVYANRPYYSRVNETKVRSNDKSFEEGTVFLRTAQDRSFYRRILDRWGDFSDKRGNNTTYDAVEPFHQTKEQDKKLEQLRNMRRQSDFKDKGLDKAITGVTILKNQRYRKNVTYKRKFQQVIETLRTKIKSSSSDDIILYLLRKRQLEEQQMLLGNEVVEKEILQQVLIELLKLRIKQLSKTSN